MGKIKKKKEESEENLTESMEDNSSKKDLKKIKGQDKEKKEEKSVPIGKSSSFRQSETNIGFCGHVDHGKTSLVKALSGTWTERYKDELNRGITIKLGYAEAEIFQCPKCKQFWTESLVKANKTKKASKDSCPNDGEKLEFIRRISFVDAPGHEILMATMLSGASLMDGAILLVSATEPCPMPQTREHLAALEIAKIEKIIIVQNKVDAVPKEKVIENFHQIQKFIKGTIAEKAPIIPVSAVFNANIDILIKTIQDLIITPHFDESVDFLFNVARSFDVNKPGREIEDLVGGVLGGSILEGQVNVGDIIEIRPGIKNKRNEYQPITTKITSIYESNQSLNSARPGGLIALGTELDPALTKSDQLIGNVIGKPNTLPPVIYKVSFEIHLLEQVLGADENIPVDPIKKGEILMIVVGTMASVGSVIELGKNMMTLDLKRPICSPEGSIAALSRKIHNRFRLIGYGYLK